MQAAPDPLPTANKALELLLFVDQRPISREQIRQVNQVLEESEYQGEYDLQIIDVTEQPHMAEYFRLLTTPALIKISPEPRHTMVGSNLLAELRTWLPRWHNEHQDFETTAIASTGNGNEPAIEPEIDPAGPQNDEPVGTYGIAQASELIKLSDEVFRLKQDNAELAAQIRFKDQVIAMLAHDLRNPLTAASIALETLDMGFHPKEGQVSRLTPALITQLIRQARSQLRNINGMITDILQAAQASQAKLKIHPQPTDLSQLCTEVLAELDDRCRQKALVIETDIPQDLPLVYVDQERIRQVLINLMDNAIKYTSGGGRIQLSALHRTTQKVQISFCDTGLGIPEDKQQIVFDDHVRLKRDREKSGYGIGLNLCQQIVRAHYGQIWVDSVLGQGSCFHFTLPVHNR